LLDAKKGPALSGNSQGMLFMPLRSAALAQVLLRKTGCSATPRLAGKTTHSLPIVAATVPTPFLSSYCLCGAKKYPYGLVNRTDTGNFLVMHPRLELGTP
jgi:hypothetical protein